MAWGGRPAIACSQIEEGGKLHLDELEVFGARILEDGEL